MPCRPAILSDPEATGELPLSMSTNFHEDGLDLKWFFRARRSGTEIVPQRQGGH